MSMEFCLCCYNGVPAISFQRLNIVKLVFSKAHCTGGGGSVVQTLDELKGVTIGGKKYKKELLIQASGAKYRIFITVSLQVSTSIT